MAFCLPKPIANKFIETLKKWDAEGGIDAKIQQLIKLSSKERQDIFTELVGKEYAKEVNSRFEGKILLKNQQQGMLSWAKSIAEPKIRKSVIEKIQSLDKYLNPEAESAFLRDLVETRLKTDITFEEAMVIHKLVQAETKAKELMDPKTFTFPSESARMEYGRKAVDLVNYVNDLKTKSKDTFFGELKGDPIKKTGEAIVELGGLTKSLKASFDNSVLFNQGLKILLTNPRIWRQNAGKSFSDIVKSFKGQDVLREIQAEIISRPNSLNGKYRQEKLDIGIAEEAYPTSLPERLADVPYYLLPIKILGKGFKASQSAFTGFQWRSRADLFDRYVEIAQRTGADTKGIGRLVNSLTGRGHLGKLEPVGKMLNNLFFSPRYLKSNIDILTGNIADYGAMGSFAKKTAAVNTLKTIGGIAVILATAEAMMPGSVEKNPTSSDFGQIRVGNTRFNVSGGASSLVVLAMRLLTGEVKSSTSGKIRKLNTGEWGSLTKSDILTNFVGNKFAPTAQLVRDLMRGQDFDGEPVTPEGALKQLTVPFPVTTYEELANTPDSADILLSLIASAIGININTYK